MVVTVDRAAGTAAVSWSEGPLRGLVLEGFYWRGAIVVFPDRAVSMLNPTSDDEARAIGEALAAEPIRAAVSAAWAAGA